jgi:hypothetical protein
MAVSLSTCDGSTTVLSSFCNSLKTGVVRFVNLGFADAEKLATQVNSIAHPVQSNPDPQTVACRG